MIIAVGTFALLVTLASGLAPPEKCERTWRKVGCFHDRIIPDRPLPSELINHRDPTNPNWDGHLLDWKQWPQSLHALACKCNELTKARGHRYFGLQFFGECWTGLSQQYNRDGNSSECIGVDYKSCNDAAKTECVGRAFTNYIYDTMGHNTKTPIDGGWTEWNQWTTCSKKCGGGVRERSRTCSNPKPEHGGGICEGSPIEEGTCNEEKCLPVCKNKLEIGVITDASSSVTSANYKKVKDFVIKLSKEFKVGEDGVHFGMIHFSWKAYLDFKMSDRTYWDPVKLKEKVLASKYVYGGTRTDLSLYMAEKEFFCDECGTRLAVPKVLIVITDGKSSRIADSMNKATKGLKEKKVTIISMGIGKAIDQEELLEIAKDKSHVFVLNDFKYMVDKLNAILKLSCNANGYKSSS